MEVLGLSRLILTAPRFGSNPKVLGFSKYSIPKSIIGNKIGFQENSVCKTQWTSMQKQQWDYSRYFAGPKKTTSPPQKKAEGTKASSEGGVVPTFTPPKTTAELFSRTLDQLDTTESEKKKKRKQFGWRRRGPTEAIAVGKTLRSSMKKLNLLAGLIRGLTYKNAVAQLKISQKRISGEVLRLVDACRFNAENVHGLEPDRLIVSEIWTGRSFFIKRLRRHARGRMGKMFRPRTNLFIVMKELPEGDERLLTKAELKQQKFIDQLDNLIKQRPPPPKSTGPDRIKSYFR